MSGMQDFVQLNITHIVKEDLLIFVIVIYLHPLRLTYTCTTYPIAYMHTHTVYLLT